MRKLNMIRNIKSCLKCKIILLVLLCCACTSNKKENSLELKSKCIFYYEKIYIDSSNNGYSIDTFYTYKAAVVSDSTNNMRHVAYYTYINPDSLKKDVFVFRVEPWGLSYVVNETKALFLSINTDHPIDWIYWYEGRIEMFKYRHSYIFTDTLFIEGLKESIPVYVFEGGFSGNEKYYLYLDKDYHLLQEIDENYPEVFSSKTELTDSLNVPKEFKTLMNGIFYTDQRQTVLH